MSRDRNVFVIPNTGRYAMERSLRDLSKYFTEVVKPDLFFHAIHKKRERVKWKAVRAKKRRKKMEARKLQRQDMKLGRMPFVKLHGKSKVEGEQGAQRPRT